MSLFPLKFEDILVRPLTSADIPKIRDLHSDVLPVQYPLSFFLQLLVLPSRLCLVAYRQSQPDDPIAFVSAAVQKSCGQLPYTWPDILSLLSPSSPRSRSVPGYDPTNPRLEILTLGVLPSYQNRGLARHLVHRVVRTLCEPLASKPGFDNGGLVVIYANVSTSNAQALKFYERMGMSVSSEVISNFYRMSSHGSRDAYLVVGLL